MLVEGSRRRVAIEACHYHRRCSDKHASATTSSSANFWLEHIMDAVRRFEGTVNQVMGDNQRKAMH